MVRANPAFTDVVGDLLRISAVDIACEQDVTKNGRKEMMLCKPSSNVSVNNIGQRYSKVVIWIWEPFQRHIYCERDPRYCWKSVRDIFQVSKMRFSRNRRGKGLWGL